MSWGDHISVFGRTVLEHQGMFADFWQSSQYFTLLSFAALKLQGWWTLCHGPGCWPWGCAEVPPSPQGKGRDGVPRSRTAPHSLNDAVANPTVFPQSSGSKYRTGVGLKWLRDVLHAFLPEHPPASSRAKKGKLLPLLTRLALHC